jgi:pimeloyl-ACP methyl ester carboxylesterase
VFAVGTNPIAAIKPTYVTIDKLKIRYASAPKLGAETLLLLSPWPESLFAFAAVWERLARDFALVAVDLPGFGQSERNRDLFSPLAMSYFVGRIVAELQLGHCHAVGPDIGTGALLFAAANRAELFKSIVVGSGGATFPLHVEGLVKTFIEADDLTPFRQADPAQGIQQFVAGIKNYKVPDAIRDDYVESYAGDRFFESIAYVRSYPRDLELLAPMLATLRTPVQIIVGRKDPYGFAKDGERLNATLAHSRFDLLDCGHCAWEEAADNYANIVADWVGGAYLNV